jgi:hypothetical protein
VRARRKRAHGPSIRTSRVRPDIGREVADIVASAQSGVARVVGLGPLIFFSTKTGDAWLLDWEDERALCLARGCTPQHVNITDTQSQFGIEWTSAYRIDGDVITFEDDSGRAVAVRGYPTPFIIETARRLAEERASGLTRG